MLKYITTKNNTQNSGHSGKQINDYFTQLGGILESLGASDVRKGGGSSCGYNRDVMDLTLQATVDRENIAWVKDVCTLGDVSGVYQNDYVNKIHQYLHFQYAGVKYLLVAFMYNDSEICSRSSDFLGVFLDYRDLPNSSTSIIPPTKRMVKHGISTSNSQIVPSTSLDFHMEHIIYKSADGKTLNIHISPVGKTGTYILGLTNFSGNYGIVHPSDRLVFNDKVDGLLNHAIHYTTNGFANILSNSAELDKVNGVMPTGEVFLGLQNTGILCKADKVIALPYTYPPTQNLIIGDKVYHRVPSLPFGYVEVI